MELTDKKLDKLIKFLKKSFEDERTKPGGTDHGMIIIARMCMAAEEYKSLRDTGNFIEGRDPVPMEYILEELKHYEEDETDYSDTPKKYIELGETLHQVFVELKKTRLIHKIVELSNQIHEERQKEDI